MKIYSVVGSATESYYELLDKDGGDTPPPILAQGLFHDNPYRVSRNTQTMTKIPFFTDDGRKSDREFRTADFVYATPTRNHPAPNLSDVIGKLADKYYGVDVNYAMYLSPEGKESANMVATTMFRLARASTQLRKGDFGGTLRELRPVPRSSRRRAYKKFTQGDLSGTWLSLHLGWAPLLNDAATISMNTPELAKAKYVRSYITASRSTRTKYKPSNTYPSRFAGGVRNSRTSVKVELRSQPSYMESLGFGNFPLLMWELVPLSFLVDYVFNVSQFLQTMQFLASRPIKRGWLKEYSRYDRWAYVPKGTAGYNSSGLYYTNRAHMFSREFWSSYKRTPYVPTMTDYVQGMHFTFPTSLTRIATAASIFHQNLLSFARKRKLGLSFDGSVSTM